MIYKYTFRSYNPDGEFSFLFETPDPGQIYPDSKKIKSEMERRYPGASAWLNIESKKLTEEEVILELTEIAIDSNYLITKDNLVSVDQDKLFSRVGFTVDNFEELSKKYLDENINFDL